MRVKWGVIGAGGIADRRTIPGILLAGNATLEAVMDIDGALAERVRAKYGAGKAYDDVDELLSDPSIQAVYIATPVAFHKEQAIRAARAGKHILLEKPVALTAADGLEVEEACRSRHVLAAAGFVMRFHGIHRQMRSMVAEGNLGRIVSCRAQLTCWYPEIPGAWRQDPSLSGGGAVLDLGVHCIDLIQYVTGSRARTVSGLIGTRTFRYAVDDSALIVFETEDGAFCHVDAHFNIPDAASKNRFEIYGTRGSLLAEETISQVERGRLDIRRVEASMAYDAGQERMSIGEAAILGEDGNLYMREIESFGDSVLGRRPVEVPLSDAIQVQRVVEAACASSRTRTHADVL